MTMEQQMVTINRKLDLLLAHFVPAEDILEAELEAQYAEAVHQMSDNPALIREFVQQYPVWVAEHNRKAA